MSDFRHQHLTISRRGSLSRMATGGAGVALISKHALAATKLLIRYQRAFAWHRWSQSRGRRMTAPGYERTFRGPPHNVRITPKTGRWSERLARMSANGRKADLRIRPAGVRF